MSTTHFVSRSDCRVDFTYVFIAKSALEAFVTGNSPVQEYSITGRNGIYERTDGLNDTGPFVSHHEVLTPRLRIPIGMADTCGADAHEHFIA